MKLVGFLLVLSLLAACSGSDDSSDTSTVYDTRLHRSCSPPDNRTLQQSVQGLVSSGVDVIDSRCGMLTGVAFIEVCGAPTGIIYLHDVHRENLTDAEAQGYSPVSELSDFATDEGEVDADVGYEVTECPAN